MRIEIVKRQGRPVAARHRSALEAFQKESHNVGCRVTGSGALPIRPAIPGSKRAEEEW